MTIRGSTTSLGSTDLGGTFKEDIKHIQNINYEIIAKAPPTCPNIISQCPKLYSKYRKSRAFKRTSLCNRAYRGCLYIIMAHNYNQEGPVTGRVWYEVLYHTLTSHTLLMFKGRYYKETYYYFFT